MRRMTPIRSRVHAKKSALGVLYCCIACICAAMRSTVGSLKRVGRWDGKLAAAAAAEEEVVELQPDGLVVLARNDCDGVRDK